MESITLENLIAYFGLYAGTFVLCFVSGFIPLINTELYLLILVSTMHQSGFVWIALVAAAGQMAAKIITYFAGKGVIHLSLKKYQNKIQATQARMERWKSRINLFLFFSAFSGFPPYYVVSIVAGMTRINFWGFLITGLLGRGLRFWLMMLFPQVFE